MTACDSAAVSNGSYKAYRVICTTAFEWLMQPPETSFGMSANGIMSVMTNVKPTVVRVHGGFVDGVVGKELHPEKGWLRREPRSEPDLEPRGGRGRANGPVVLVGHSYGGVVSTAADNDPKVSKLV